MNLDEIRKLHRQLEREVRANGSYARRRKAWQANGASEEYLDKMEHAILGVMLVDSSHLATYLRQSADMAKARGFITADEETLVSALAPHLQSQDAQGVLGVLRRAPASLKQGRLKDVFPEAEAQASSAAQKSDSNDDVEEARRGWAGLVGGAIGALIGALAFSELGPAGAAGGGILGWNIGKHAGETAYDSSVALDGETGFMPRPDGSDCVTPGGL